MRIIFATWASVAYQGQALTEEGAVDRLVSFYEVRERPEHILSEYVKQGFVDKPKKRRKKS